MLFLSALAALAAPTIEVTGTCPGDAAISVSGLTPGASTAVVYSPGTGSDPLPAGACRGVVSGLSPLRWALTMADSDGDGTIVFTPDLPGGVCDRYLQAVDLSDCSISDVFSLATVPAVGGNILYASTSTASYYGGVEAANLYAIDLDSGAVTVVGPTGIGITGLSFTTDGRLFGIQDAVGSDIVEVDPATGAATYVTTHPFLPYKNFLGWAGGQLLVGSYPGEAGSFDPDTGMVTLDVALEGAWHAAHGPVPLETETGIHLVGNGGNATWDPATGEELPGVPYVFVDRPDGYAMGFGGSGATVHRGTVYAIWGNFDDYYSSSMLVTIDLVTGEVRDTGIVLDNWRLDGLASPTP